MFVTFAVRARERRAGAPLQIHHFREEYAWAVLDKGMPAVRGILCV